jgi:Fe-coproporphyrin III synthase
MKRKGKQKGLPTPHTFCQGWLGLPYGEKRNEVVYNLIELKKKYQDFVINPVKQTALMKGNGGGIGTVPVDCPSCTIL